MELPLDSLSTAGGTPPLGYLAGRVVTPASPGIPPREGEAGPRCFAFPLLSLQ